MTPKADTTPEEITKEHGLMLWTILVIILMLGLVVIGQLGGGVIHLLLSIATLVLAFQLFSESGNPT
jgi:hypothetical protein